MRKRTLCMAVGTAGVEPAGRNLYLLMDGRRIARRGRPGTPQARTWVSLEPGWKQWISTMATSKSGSVACIEGLPELGITVAAFETTVKKVPKKKRAIGAKVSRAVTPRYEPDDGPLTDEQHEAIAEMVRGHGRFVVIASLFGGKARKRKKK